VPSQLDVCQRLAGVAADELAAARDAIDAVLWRRDVRAAAKEVARASVTRGARDSAAIDGADIPEPDHSPMGVVLANAQSVTAQATGLADVFLASPLQVLAALASAASAGMVSDELRSRPRSTQNADDPLNIGGLLDASAVPQRLLQVARQVMTTSAPALAQAAFVHAELLALRPFAFGSGLVGRASVRTVLAARGLDPSGFTIPELGMFASGRSSYVAAIRSYATATDEGLHVYVTWFATAMIAGAQAVTVPEH
jgi:hypothetical protein